MLEEILNTKTPALKITVSHQQEKTEITQLVSDRLIHLGLEDNRGFEADMLDLELSDHDGKLALPPRGAIIELAFGWKGSLLIDKGKYVVDEVQYSGAPDRLTIRARSADLRGSLSTKKERSFHNISLGDLITKIAEDNKLKALCGKAFAQRAISHLDQVGESDINLLSRLAKEYDAIATVKNGTLLFIPAGEGKTATGKPIPNISISKKSGDNYNFIIAEGDNYKAVRAYWHDTNTGKRGEIIIDENSEVTKINKKTKKGKVSKAKKTALIQHQPVTSDSEQMKTLEHTYASEARAINGAKSAFSRIKRGVATFSLSLAFGNPELMPEMPVRLQGFKTEIDNTEWIITKVSHEISDSGFTSNVEMEVKTSKEEKDFNVRKAG